MIERHHPSLSVGAQCRLLSISPRLPVSGRHHGVVDAEGPSAEGQPVHLLRLDRLKRIAARISMAGRVLPGAAGDP